MAAGLYVKVSPFRTHFQSTKPQPWRANELLAQSGARSPLTARAGRRNNAPCPSFLFGVSLCPRTTAHCLNAHCTGRKLKFIPDSERRRPRAAACRRCVHPSKFLFQVAFIDDCRALRLQATLNDSCVHLLSRWIIVWPPERDYYSRTGMLKPDKCARKH